MDNNKSKDVFCSFSNKKSKIHNSKASTAMTKLNVNASWDSISDQLLSNSNSLKSQQGSLKADVENKKELRKVRKRYHTLFKEQNRSIFRQRLVNVRNSQIIFGMRRCLADLVPEEKLTKDLILYLIGICKIKKLSNFRYRDDLKQEIIDYLNWTTSYSNPKLIKCMKSENLRTLCEYIDIPLSGKIAEHLKL